MIESDLFRVEPGDEWQGTEAFMRAARSAGTTAVGSGDLSDLTHRARLGAHMSDGVVAQPAPVQRYCRSRGDVLLSLLT